MLQYSERAWDPGCSIAGRDALLRSYPLVLWPIGCTPSTLIGFGNHGGERHRLSEWMYFGSMNRLIQSVASFVQ